MLMFRSQKQQMPHGGPLIQYQEEVGNSALNESTCKMFLVQMDEWN